MDSMSLRNLNTRPWPAVFFILGLALFLISGLLILLRFDENCPFMQLATQLAGSNERLGSLLGEGRCIPDLGRARWGLLIDLGFVAGYCAFITGILLQCWWRYEAPPLKRFAPVVFALPFVVAGLDLTETVVTLISLREVDGRYAYVYDWLPMFIATVSWAKWLLVVPTVVTVVMAIAVGFSRRKEKLSPNPLDLEKRTYSERNDAPAVGVCCSGGGIRSTAFSLGALAVLEEKGVLTGARWLTAVSGGAFAATAWTLERVKTRGRAPSDAARAVIRRLKEPPDWGTSPYKRHRYLRNGPGGLLRPALKAVGCVVMSLVLLGLIAFVIAWPLGWVLGTRFVRPELRAADLPQNLAAVQELWQPGVWMILFGVVLVGATAWFEKLANWWRIAVTVMLGGLVLEIYLVGLPWGIVETASWWEGSGAAKAAVAGSTALASVLAGVARIASRPLTGLIAPRLPELGGLILAAVALLWACSVASAAAVGQLNVWWCGIACLVLAVMYYVFDPNSPSLHNLYRQRLQRTFDPIRESADKRRRWDQRRSWDRRRKWTDAEVGDMRPELILCCAQQRTGLASGGLRAESFTISPVTVRLGEIAIPTKDYFEALDTVKSGWLRKQGFAVDADVSAWTATSGAAFASAMGRLSKGSTNALLAATGVDLGIWLPNPRIVSHNLAVKEGQQEGQQIKFPRPRLAYLMKEILGWYHDSDRYVFLADGGHWDNLGLVELLRRQCTDIYCIDGSGDKTGSFATLRQSIDLALLTLDRIVKEINLGSLDVLRPGSGDVPEDLATTIRFEYCNGTKARIHYAKLQVTGRMGIDLRRFAQGDPNFPNYSTGNQLLTDAQFERLVELGEYAGGRLVEVERASRRSDGASDASGRRSVTVPANGRPPAPGRPLTSSAPSALRRARQTGTPRPVHRIRHRH